MMEINPANTHESTLSPLFLSLNKFSKDLHKGRRLILYEFDDRPKEESHIL